MGIECSIEVVARPRENNSPASFLIPPFRFNAECVLG